MKSWLVPYRLTTQGTAVVEAENAEAAVALVENGDFEADSGEERVDWAADGDAEENR